MILGGCELVAFIATVDLDRARAFYGETLGLSLVEQTSFACVFDAAGTTLRVTLVDELAPARHTVLGWAMADVVGVVRTLHERGIAFERYPGLEQDGLAIWTAPSGARVAWFTDPDGNVLSVTQL